VAKILIFSKWNFDKTTCRIKDRVEKMIIEVVGSAGSGKSTLAKALSERLDNARLELPPSISKTENIPFFVRNTLGIFPILPSIYLRRKGRYSPWYHFLFTVILHGWHKVLDQKTFKVNSIFILDQGPVYMITFETLFGSTMFESNISKKYWERTFYTWSKTLDLVIWLDASLPVLVERIRKRETRHGIKGLYDMDAYRYLEAYHQAYDSVISKLRINSNKLKVLPIDTGQYSLEDTINIIVNHLQQENHKV